jgi:hypothetical protein
VLPGGPLATQIPNALADPWRSLHLLVHYGPLRSHELVDSFDPDGLPQVSQVDNEIDAPETGHDIASDASSVGCWPRRRNDPSRKLVWLREAAFSISVTKEALCEPIFDAGRSIAKLLAAPAPANLDRVMFSTNAGIRAARQAKTLGYQDVLVSPAIQKGLGTRSRRGCRCQHAGSDAC